MEIFGFGVFVLFETGSHNVSLPRLDKASFVGDFVLLLLVCPGWQLLGLQVWVSQKGKPGHTGVPNSCL